MAEIIYAPGLGGERVVARQRRYIEFLNRHRDRQIYFFDPRWQTKEPAKEKLQRLHTAYEAAGRPNKIVGVSAGATMAVILGALNPSAEIETFAGKHRDSSTLGEERRSRAPALAEFVDMSQNILETEPHVIARLTSRRPILFDGVVPHKDIYIPGADNKFLLLPFHSSGIYAGLLLNLPRL